MLSSLRIFLAFVALLGWPLYSPGPWWFTLIGMLVLGIAYGVALAFDYATEDEQVMFPFYTIVASLCIYVGLLAYHEDTVETETKLVRVSSTPMYSLQPFAGTSGTFFLGGGTVNTDYQYVTYVRQPDGGLSATILAGDAVIYEDAASVAEARYEVFHTYERESRANMPAFWRYVLGYDTFTTWDRTRYDSTIKIHVPEGTVIQEFTG